jgi:hypothetical protein
LCVFTGGPELRGFQIGGHFDADRLKARVVLQQGKGAVAASANNHADTVLLGKTCDVLDQAIGADVFSQGQNTGLADDTARVQIGKMQVRKRNRLCGNALGLRCYSFSFVRNAITL